MKKLERLIDLLYQEKYGLYMGENTDDLSQLVVDGAWSNEKSVWNDA